MAYLLAHDLGTSGNKAVLHSETGILIASCLQTYSTQYPHDGWVEQDAKDWWKAVCKSRKQLLETARIAPAEIAAISFSEQMMGCLPVDQAGIPLRPMITWADTRASRQESWMLERASMDRVYAVTGHRVSASYAAAKLLWIRENEPEVFKKTAHMLQAKDYVIYRMTGQIVTDYSDASGTNLFDIREKRWSQELLNAWEIPASILSELHPSTDIAGTITQQAALETGLLEGTPVVIGGGDGSCACVGAGVVQDKQAYCVLGSSSWISAASREPVFDPKKRTLNWVHLAPCLYTPCGTMQAAGYSYRWFCNTLCDAEKQQVQENEKNVCDILNERVKHTPAGAGGLLYLPYLLGERSPRWDSKVRGAFLGLSVTTGKAEMARAVMEGVGMNLYVILQALKTQVPINRLALIGGGAQGDVWPQILADIWGMPVETAVHSIEATSMGAAICAGVGIGLYRSFREAFVAQMETRVFNPDSQANAVYRRLCPLFEQAYESLGKVSDGLALFRERIVHKLILLSTLSIISKHQAKTQQCPWFLIHRCKIKRNSNNRSVMKKIQKITDQHRMGIIIQTQIHGYQTSYCYNYKRYKIPQELGQCLHLLFQGINNPDHRQHQCKRKHDIIPVWFKKYIRCTHIKRNL